MGTKLAQGLLVAGVVLLAGSLFLAFAAVFGAGIDGIVFALRGLVLALACLLGAGVVAAVRRSPAGGG